MRADTTYLTTRDLADRWRLSEWTIRDYARRGLITGVERAGRQFRFALDASLAIGDPSAKQFTQSKKISDTVFDDFARELAHLNARRAPAPLSTEAHT